MLSVEILRLWQPEAIIFVIILIRFYVFRQHMSKSNTKDAHQIISTDHHISAWTTNLTKSAVAGYPFIAKLLRWNNSSQQPAYPLMDTSFNQKLNIPTSHDRVFPRYILYCLVGFMLLQQPTNAQSLQTVTTIAGTGSAVTSANFLVNGVSALTVNLDVPTGVWSDTVGNVFIAEKTGNCVRKVSYSVDSVSGE